MDSIPSPSPSVEIQIIDGKICLRCKGKTLLGDVNKLFVCFQSLLTTPSNVLPLHLKQTFPPIQIWIFTEGDGIEFRLPFKIFSTHHLTYIKWFWTKAMFPMFAMSFVTWIDVTFSILDWLTLPLRHTAAGFLKNLITLSVLSFLWL